MDGPGPQVDEENKIGTEPLMGDAEDMEVTDNLNFVAGTCLALECERMKKLVFRVTQGKAACYFN